MCIKPGCTIKAARGITPILKLVNELRRAMAKGQYTMAKGQYTMAKGQYTMAVTMVKMLVV